MLGEKRKLCNCKNSRCLKLYCECFASGVYVPSPRRARPRAPQATRRRAPRAPHALAHHAAQVLRRVQLPRLLQQPGER